MTSKKLLCNGICSPNPTTNLAPLTPFSATNARASLHGFWNGSSPITRFAPSSAKRAALPPYPHPISSTSFPCRFSSGKYLRKRPATSISYSIRARSSGAGSVQYLGGRLGARERYFLANVTDERNIHDLQSYFEPHEN